MSVVVAHGSTMDVADVAAVVVFWCCSFVAVVSVVLIAPISYVVDPHI